MLLSAAMLDNSARTFNSNEVYYIIVVSNATKKFILHSV